MSDYPTDYPPGWLTEELALYDRFNVRHAGLTIYDIAAQVSSLPRDQKDRFYEEWRDLCDRFGAGAILRERFINLVPE